MTENLREEPGYEHYYLWQEAQTACPTGWHLPTEEEWRTFSNYVDNNLEQDVNIPLFFEYQNYIYWSSSTSPWSDGNGTEFTLTPIAEMYSNPYRIHLGSMFSVDQGEHCVVRCLRD